MRAPPSCCVGGGPCLECLSLPPISPVAFCCRVLTSPTATLRLSCDCSVLWLCHGESTSSSPPSTTLCFCPSWRLAPSLPVSLVCKMSEPKRTLLEIRWLCGRNAGKRFLFSQVTTLRLWKTAFISFLLARMASPVALLISLLRIVWNFYTSSTSAVFSFAFTCTMLIVAIGVTTSTLSGLSLDYGSQHVCYPISSSTVDDLFYITRQCNKSWLWPFYRTLY